MSFSRKINTDYWNCPTVNFLPSLALLAQTLARGAERAAPLGKIELDGQPPVRCRAFRCAGGAGSVEKFETSWLASGQGGREEGESLISSRF